MDLAAREYDVPIWHKEALTLEEAAAYSGLGIKTLKEITTPENCDFVLWVGTRRLIKRRGLERYIENTFSI